METLSTSYDWKEMSEEETKKALREIVRVLTKSYNPTDDPKIKKEREEDVSKKIKTDYGYYDTPSLDISISSSHGHTMCQFAGMAFYEGHEEEKHNSIIHF